MRTKKPIHRKRAIRALYIIGLLIPLSLLGVLVWTTLQGQGGASHFAFSRHPPSLTLAGGSGDTPWYLRLVNATHPLPDGWDPELSTIDPFSGEKFDSRAIESLWDMLEDMRAQGMEPRVCSGYRSYESQVDIFQENVQSALNEGCTQEEAEQKASLWVMPPGCSEHQSALAVDIVSEGNQNLDETQDDTDEQEWLHAHCQEYGFILRYPKGKTELTGVNYEPWHYRFVGEEAAREITSQGICLEEFHAPPAQALDS